MVDVALGFYRKSTMPPFWFLLPFGALWVPSGILGSEAALGPSVLRPPEFPLRASPSRLLPFAAFPGRLSAPRGSPCSLSFKVRRGFPGRRLPLRAPGPGSPSSDFRPGLAVCDGEPPAAARPSGPEMLTAVQNGQKSCGGRQLVSSQPPGPGTPNVVWPNCQTEPHVGRYVASRTPAFGLPLADFLGRISAGRISASCSLLPATVS